MKITTYHEIDWKECSRFQRNLQNDIVIAYRQNDYRKVSKLQKIGLHSPQTIALAVRKVSTSDGSKTAGADGIIWNTPAEKLQVIKEFSLKNYIAKPVKRVHIPKGDGSLRPIGIPTMTDRLAQQLWASVLSPIAEETGDRNSYAYRPHRSAHDALSYCQIVFGKSNSAEWVLNLDIKGFFDNISHQWILENIPVRKKVLAQWLKCGIIEKGEWSPTDGGVPQGGVISPLIANMVLDGLEDAVAQSVKHLLKGKKETPKVHMIRYADDVRISAKTREILVELVLPAVEKFLRERGLFVHPDKTYICSIYEGFDFIGFTIRKYRTDRRKHDFIYIVMPSKKKIIGLRSKLKTIVEEGRDQEASTLIARLNPVLRGWSNYYRYCSAKKAFAAIGYYLWNILWKWAKRKHRHKPRRELKRMYFLKRGHRNWIFSGEMINSAGMKSNVELFDIANVSIRRHVLVKDLNPFSLENKTYYDDRSIQKLTTSVLVDGRKKHLIDTQKAICPHCNQWINWVEEDVEIHHVVSRKEGGSNAIENLVLLHKVCHQAITHSK